VSTVRAIGRPRWSGGFLGSWLLLLVQLIVLAVPRSALADDDEMSVVVLPLRIEGDLSASRRDELEAGLRAGLERAGLQRGQAPTTAVRDCETSTCAAELARATQADFAIVARMTVVRRDYDMSIEVIDARQAKVIASSAERCEICGIAEVLELVDTQAAALSARLSALRLGAPVFAFESSPAGALIRLDGTVVGETPFEREVEPGARRVSAELPGYVTQAREIEAVAGVRSTVDFVLTPIPRSVRHRRLRTFGWTAIGVGGAAVVVGVPLIAVHGRENRLVCTGENVDPRGNCKYLHATRGPGIAVTVVGAVLLATGVSIVLATRPRARERRSAALGVGPRGMTLTGRF
jgi:hypothetical protein